MGLLDILNGMQNGPRGQRQPNTNTSGGGGLSPMMMALLGLLAYKALKGSGGQAAAPGVNPNSPGGGLGDLLGGLLGGGPGARPGGAGPGGGGLGDVLGGLLGGGPGARPGGAGPGGGGLADMIPGGLGGLLGGAAAGSVLSGGLGNLIKELQQSGQGSAAQSWVGTGPNEEIAPNDLANALGSDTLESLSRQTGMGQNDLLAGLSQYLPDLVDQLTPNGRLPTEDEASRLV
jgi:uncharacterized protein YidB (DUF937 family)